MDEISNRLYRYLCNNVVGTENVVKFRRYFYEVVDNLWDKNVPFPHKIKQISSGSKAEGMDLPGSDYDVMQVNLNPPVYDNPVYSKLSIETECFKNKIVLIIDTELAQPGFALLRVSENTDDLSSDIIITTEFGSFLSGRLFRMKLLELYKSRLPCKINGPCISDISDSMDKAHTLKCDSWPTVAQNWIVRPRSFGWPSAQLISDICKQGVLFVPIGSKSDSQDDNPLEWRISFSVSEKLLIHSWNHSQFLCYALLKLLSKDVVKKNKNVDKLICSYFLKTTIFWLSEEQSLDIWTAENLLHCFMLCLERLIYWNERNYIPNYFMPQHNMIDRKIPGQSRTELVSLLRNLHNTGWACLLQCESLRGFNYLNIFGLTRSNQDSDCDKATLPLLPCFNFENEDYINLNSEFKKCLQQTINGNLTLEIRSLFFYFLANSTKYIAKHMFYDCIRHKNKQVYLQQRQWLPYALIGTYTDSMSGWLLVAFYFYIHKQYYKSLEILDLIQMFYAVGRHCYSNINGRRIHCDEPNRIAQCFGKTTFFRYIRLNTTLVFSLEAKPDDKLNYDEHIRWHPTCHNYYCPSGVFLHYLGFLCHHQLGDITQRQTSLYNLAWAVQNDYHSKDAVLRHLSCLYLSKAFAISGDIQNAIYWLTDAKRIPINV